MRALAMVLLALGLSGCGLLSGVPETLDDAHVVSLTMEGCNYVLTESRAGSYSVMAGIDQPLANGDIIIGPVRSGTLVLDLLPFPREDGTLSVRLDVHAVGLSGTEGRHAWRDACGRPL